MVKKKVELVEQPQGKQSYYERLLAPKQWKIFEGIKVENVSNKIRRVIITIPQDG